MKVLIVLPVYNEQEILETNILRLIDFCQKNLIDAWRIIISDNNSSDRTAIIAQKLARANSKITYFHLTEKGKGLAIRRAWQEFTADVYIFMDVDLATDLSALPSLIEGVADGYDVVVGSRFLASSQVSGRNLLRRLTSWGYSLIARSLLRLKVKDAPCGFKAINQRVKEKILPQVENTQWFFDTELLMRAERAGLKILEVPVIWQESKRVSRVSVIRLSLQYLKELIRLALKNK